MGIQCEAQMRFENNCGVKIGGDWASSCDIMRSVRKLIATLHLTRCAFNNKKKVCRNLVQVAQLSML